MKLSVHIVSCGRLALLRECVSSVREALPADSEVWIIVNGACALTIDYLEQLGDDRFYWIEVERESLSRARNRAFELCRGEIIYFLDDDVVIPISLFRNALEYFCLNPKSVLVGGPNLTPPDSSWIERIFGGIMGSGFAAPMVRARYVSGNTINRNANEHQFIFCNLGFRSTAIPMGIRFREDFISNQENLFIYLCRKMDLECAMISELFVYHRRRKNIGSFLTQVASYGYGRFQQTAASPKSCHPLFFVPALSVLGLLILIFLGQLNLLFCLLGFYASGALIGSVGSVQLRKEGFRGIIAGAMLTGPLHLWYAFGWLRGLFDFFIHSSTNERSVFGHRQSLFAPSIGVNDSTRN